MRRWPFEGRQQELAAIRSAFCGSAAHAVLLMGAAGVGKTRLARETLARLGGRGDWIAGTRSASQIPLGPMLHLVPEEVPVTAGSAELVRAIHSRVAGWGGRHDGVLGVDDAHQLDAASAMAIAALITKGSAFVVLTARSGEPLADCLSRLVKEGQADVLELGVLPDAVMDRLIDHSTGGRIDVTARRTLHATARGNPLALRELVHGAVPGGLADLIVSRLAGLKAEVRAVVEMVACGEPVPLSLLERSAGAEPVMAAEEAGVVVCERAANRVQARLEHPLFGEVLLARMPVTGRRRAYQTLARELMATPMRRREDVLRAALWQVECGRITRPDLVHEGALQAVGRTGMALAERLARASREVEPGPRANWLMAEILEYQGRSGEAAGLLPATPPPDLAERIAWAIIRAKVLYWSQGDVPGATATWDTVAGHPVIEAARAFVLFFDGRCRDVVRIADKVLADPGGNPQAVVWAAGAATASLGFLGRIEEAGRRHAEGRATAIAHAAALPVGAFQMEVGACLAQLAAGEPGRAAATAAAAYQATLSGGAPILVSGWAFFGGVVALAQGRLDRAGSLLTEGRAGFGQTDTQRLHRCCLAALAGVRALQGRRADAVELLARADALDNGTNQIFAPWVETWRAWVARAGGDVDAALRHAARAAALAAAAGMPYVEALARYEAVRLGGAADQEVLRAIPGALPALLATAVRALAAKDTPALSRTARELNRLGYHLHAAELATAAARHARRTGSPPEAGLAVAAANEMRAACAGARTPLLAEEPQDDLRDFLTPRERQIALLAPWHTSKQIAQRLGLAVRTVDNALSRVYVKLGVSGRADLRPYLEQPPDDGA
ncbi:AAA family ATPase [Nonomuraea typhae]|uniref:AAA family ATPase n=1 Tax=Nonomuraea typhae TaxID=2603600 RepID=UPI0012F86869|nr:AAA family ATPase [Nonomuraea typhae]